MNFTVANHNDRYNSKGFIHYDSVDFEDIPEMVTSGYAYASARFTDNHRLDEKYEGQEDVLILDIDEKVSIEQAKIIFAKYTNFIITSKSHQKEKNGEVCDRYRVFIRLSETLNDSDSRVEFINNVFSIFPFVDKSCRNPSRFYYSSPEDAEVFYNEGKSLPIIKSKLAKKVVSEQTLISQGDYIPRGLFVFNELSNQWINEFGEIIENESGLNEEAKLRGAEKVFEEEFYSGNRNHCIFKVACMLLKDGLEEDTIITFLTTENDKRDGVGFNELMQCIRSAKKKV